jgi:hypothetical protein
VVLTVSVVLVVSTWRGTEWDNAINRSFEYLCREKMSVVGTYVRPQMRMLDLPLRTKPLEAVGLFLLSRQPIQSSLRLSADSQLRAAS